MNKAIRDVSTRQLRGGLFDHLREVQGGARLRVMSNTAPVAALVPCAEVEGTTLGESCSIKDLRDHLAIRLETAGAGTLIPVTRFTDTLGVLGPLSLLERPDQPPRVLSFWNEAGGIGKTTLSCDLAALLAARGERVLLIDLDPQRSLTWRSGLLDQPGPAARLASSLQVALQDPEADFPAPLPFVEMPDLHLIPAHPGLRVLDGGLLSSPSMLGSLRTHLARLRGYDWVLIDTPPSNGGLTRAALVASGAAVVPLMTTLKSIENLAQVSQVLAECRSLNPGLHITAFVPMSYNPGRNHDRAVLTRIEQNLPALAPITTPLRERKAAYLEAGARRSAVSRLLPSSEAAQELNAVLTDLLTGMLARPVEVTA